MHALKRFHIDAGRARAACSRSQAPKADRILIVDDHGLVRRGLALAIQSRQPDCSVFEAATLAQALRRAASIPDLSAVLYDLRLADASGLGGLRTLLDAVGDVPVIVISGEIDGRIVGDCLRAGARGVLPKSCDGEVLDHALPLVIAGGVYAPLMHAHRHGPMAAEPRPPAGPGRIEELTERQRAVLQLLMDGRSNKEIARELGVLEGTVKVHLRAIMQKLRVRNRTQLALAAARAGLGVYA